MSTRPHDVEVAVLTGLSGAGRSEAAKALEDLGWFVIDNLPPALVDKMISLALASGNELKRVAFVIDVRGGTFFSEAQQAVDDLRRDAGNFSLVFLEASDDALVRRFAASRRLHPLAIDQNVVAGLRRERAALSLFREQADLIIDTSDLSVRDLRFRIAAHFEDRPAGGLKTTVVSFGYKHGLPLDADVVLDVRFLPNPHWVPSLRPLPGTEEPVRRYVLEQEATTEFLLRARDLLTVMLPGFQAEGRHYLTIAIGCTGGRHRSVVLAPEVAGLLREKGYSAKVINRDVDRTT